MEMLRVAPATVVKSIEGAKHHQVRGHQKQFLVLHDAPMKSQLW
jgi:hypothetical protein